jgi:hypothetical protein
MFVFALFPEHLLHYGRSSDSPLASGLPGSRARTSGVIGSDCPPTRLWPTGGSQQRVLSRIFTGFPFHSDAPLGTGNRN